MVVGAFAFRMVYTIALRLDMPAFMLKLVSSVIVVLAIAAPYFKKQLPMLRRRMLRERRPAFMLKIEKISKTFNPAPSMKRQPCRA